MTEPLGRFLVCVCSAACAVSLFLGMSSCAGGVDVNARDARGCAESCSAGMNNVTLTLENKEYGTVTIRTDSEGNYSFDKVWPGTYTITPGKEGYSFFPNSRTITINGAEQENLDFITMISWSRTFREGVENKIYYIEQTSDCGYVMCGMIDRSGALNLPEAANIDFWVVKINRYGEVEWEWINGGVNVDYAYSVHQRENGTFVVTGSTYNATTGFDVRIVQLSVAGGTPTVDWDTTLAGGAQDEGRCVIYSDFRSEYIVAGSTESWGSGLRDFLLFPLNGGGAYSGPYVFGSVQDETANFLRETFDATGIPDGYVLTGSRIYPVGDEKAVLWRLNENFMEVWNREYAANESKGVAAEVTVSRCIKETIDNGYIVAGETRKKRKDFSDLWVSKLNGDGTVAWEKILDKGFNDAANSVHQTTDQGYIVGGYTSSGATEFADYWFIKLSHAGDLQWDKNFKGKYEGHDEITSVAQTTDGGYIIAGNTQAMGGKDYTWLLKLDIYGNIVGK